MISEHTRSLMRGWNGRTFREVSRRDFAARLIQRYWKIYIENKYK
jgi:hypothetical protein